MKTTIAQWKQAATETANAVKSAKAGNETRNSIAGKFAFLSLQFMLQGTLQDKVAIGKSIAKDGEFNALKQYVSRAKFLSENMIDGKLQFVQGKGKKAKPFTITQAAIMAVDTEAEELPFSVSTAYNAIRASQEAVTETVELTDADYAALYLQGAVDFATLSPEEQAEAVTQGRLIHAETVKAETVPELKAEIAAQFAALVALDASAAREILGTLSVPVSEIPYTVAELEAA